MERCAADPSAAPGLDSPGTPSSRRPLTQAQKDKRRLSTKISKRRATLFRKAHDFHKDCGFEAYLLLWNGHRSFVYNSRPVAPPEHAQVMESYPLPIVYNPEAHKDDDGARSGSQGL
ncbi:Uu.00g130180.m01.CDS01 [Anthostomella pinea]|uniref:Uu.00g130180.m01.CDS01 n=1 Tax=Anthostomella pinea TaxID=933095 RepID=A0AAI8YI50_9PEZI|nr:Uu.00g130180.m01.CDS01 [Anthostomella pinea]